LNEEGAVSWYSRLTYIFQQLARVVSLFNSSSFL